MAALKKLPIARSKGFSLIEIMIVVIILAVIAAIAIPAYQDTVIRGNRSDGKTALTTTAQALERCYTRFRAYNADDCEVNLPIASESGWYVITVDNSTIGANGFTLTAVPQNRQTRDAECMNFTLDHRGARGISGSGTVGNCW